MSNAADTQEQPQEALPPLTKGQQHVYRMVGNAVTMPKAVEMYEARNATERVVLLARAYGRVSITTCNALHDLPPGSTDENRAKFLARQVFGDLALMAATVLRWMQRHLEPLAIPEGDYPPTLDDLLSDAVRRERLRQEAKWGLSATSGSAMFHLILGEEVAELTDAALCLDAQGGYMTRAQFDHIFLEATQVAAVCVRWMEAIEGCFALHKGAYGPSVNVATLTHLNGVPVEPGITITREVTE